MQRSYKNSTNSQIPIFVDASTVCWNFNLFILLSTALTKRTREEPIHFDVDMWKYVRVSFSTKSCVMIKSKILCVYLDSVWCCSFNRRGVVHQINMCNKFVNNKVLFLYLQLKKMKTKKQREVTKHYRFDLLFNKIAINLTLLQHLVCWVSNYATFCFLFGVVAPFFFCCNVY